MASVSSLDQDMQRLRLDRYTPKAANEVRSWIEDTLGERLPAGDLLDSLKDGVALCKLANLILPSPGIKYKASAMPFVQRENVSHFLTACERSPLNLPAHDRFLTVDLYDNKDPAQVLQCLSAFSRAINSIDSSRFPHVIGPKRTRAASSTRRTANGGLLGDGYTRNRGASNASQGTESSFDAKTTTTRAMSPALADGSTASRASAVGNVSSWSKKSDEGMTAPAWNIHQYGYMGGASQGNQGVSFGARRQITSPSPMVPSLAEKEQRRKQREMEEERTREEALEQDRRNRAERESAREGQRFSEEESRLEEARRVREREREELELEQRRWEEQERRWKEEEEQRKGEEERSATAVAVSIRPAIPDKSRRVTETERIRELERQLEEAKERERQYQRQREGRTQSENASEPEQQAAGLSEKQPDEVSESAQVIIPAKADQETDETDEAETLRNEWQKHQATGTQSLKSASPPKSSYVSNDKPVLPAQSRFSAPSSVSRLKTPPPPASPKASPPSPLPRPLPDPTPYFSMPTTSNRTDRFLASNTPPTISKPKIHYPSEIGMTSASERAAEDARRVGGQTKTKAGGWASKSLLEREMEKERERQKEWEEAQMQRTQGGARSGGLLGPRELKR